jgi:hypothetical protein
MAEQMTAKTEATKRTCKHIRFAVMIGILVIIAALAYRHHDYQSIDERLAVIEASLAIPDSENAAIFYDKLLQNPDAIMKDQSNLHGPDIMATRSQYWTKEDYPKIAIWITDHQWLINELMKVKQFEKCRFPLIVEPRNSIPLNRARTMRQWTFLLCQAANNDVGEGRIDDAIAKWQCLIQIGKHFRQQSQLFEYLSGMGIESVGTMKTISFLAESNASENHLRKIESFQVQTHDDWPAVLDRTGPIEQIEEQKFKRQLSLFDRFKYEFGLGQFRGVKDIVQIARRGHLRALAYKRGMYIMVALRRYKNEYGHWPQTLNSIKQWVAEDVLTDPYNNGTYIYQITEDGFRLYSIGLNGKDENGRYKLNGPDDWSIWPRGKKSNSKQKDTNSKQSDTEMEKKVIE